MQTPRSEVNDGHDVDDRHSLLRKYLPCLREDLMRLVKKPPAEGTSAVFVKEYSIIFIRLRSPLSASSTRDEVYVCLRMYTWVFVFAAFQALFA